MKPKVHQILATLGYGDAIGNEVLGICRTLRAAGFESEIIVDNAEPRLEDLTVDYQEKGHEIGPDDRVSHRFSNGSRAARPVLPVMSRRYTLVTHGMPSSSAMVSRRALVRSSSGRSATAAVVWRSTRAPTGWRTAW